MGVLVPGPARLIRERGAAMQAGALSVRNQSPSWTVRGPAWEPVSRPKTERGGCLSAGRWVTLPGEAQPERGRYRERQDCPITCQSSLGLFFLLHLPKEDL